MVGMLSERPARSDFFGFLCGFLGVVHGRRGWLYGAAFAMMMALDMRYRYPPPEVWRFVLSA